MVGRVGGEQKLSIGRGCERLGTAIHEISHSLGFWHEQVHSYIKEHRFGHILFFFHFISTPFSNFWYLRKFTLRYQ